MLFYQKYKLASKQHQDDRKPVSNLNPIWKETLKEPLFLLTDRTPTVSYFYIAFYYVDFNFKLYSLQFVSFFAQACSETVSALS